MRVHRASKLIGCRLELHRDASLGDQFGCMWSNNVNSENLIVFLLADNLNEAFLLANDSGLTRSRERKPSHLDVVTLFASLGFRQSN